MTSRSSTTLTITIGAVATLVLVSCSPAFCGEQQDRPGYLTPPELFKVAESSENTYTFSTVEEATGLEVDSFAELFWPPLGDSIRYPWIDTEDGQRNLSSYTIEESCLETLQKAEPLFQDKKYAQALALYRKAVEESPDCYVAHLSVGDAHYFQGQLDEALECYDRAIALNPYDFLGHFYRANALLRLGRFEEARFGYVRALAMRPHRESILQVTRARQEDLGIRVTGEPFRPKALARQEDDGVWIYIDPEAPHWLTYGLCKAIWIGEPSHREERTGSTEHVWSLVEERQCLMSLLEAYHAHRSEGDLGPDPALERLLAILEDGMIDGFVMYEMASRLYDHSMLLLPDEMFEEVLGYVDAHVLVRTEDVDDTLDRGPKAP